MICMARTGAQWRHLPDEYGKWNSVFRRCRRWVATGVQARTIPRWRASEYART
ncbi:transposase (plasmid) [Mesorhizobium loti]|nr:transposase [Mesorhizobium loti]